MNKFQEDSSLDENDFNPFTKVPNVGVVEKKEAVNDRSGNRFDFFIASTNDWKKTGHTLNRRKERKEE